ncbi:protein kinase, AMP-activated, alpha 2 catalytic subunit [Podila verticillata]|nr:protein kinase, AMP-activated, alpha 2 catalytic subunit [Podila verticillata]KFH68893.1 CAMK/CAMKL protein kinase [Podila verticillata NRRL 6337]
MAATASHQRRRNVIIIPIDVYRKYTESSSSDSSSMPARWPTSCGRASRDRKADNKFSTASLLTSLHMSHRVKPQIQGGGKPKVRTRAHLLQRHSKSKASSTFQTTTPQRNAESNLAYHTQHHGHQDMVMKAPSNAGTLSKPSAEDLLPFEQPSKPKKSAVTIGGTIATINLHSLPATPSRSMKRGRSASDPPVDPKRIKLRLNVKHSGISTAAQASIHDHRTTHPVIVISDSDDDMPTAAHAPTPPRQYRLEKHLRRIVDSIFPAHELGNQATLERALSTCPQLRYDYLIDRFLGSGSSGFVISAKRITDGKDVAIKVIPHAGDQTENKVRRELDILVSIKSHENILDFVEYFTSSLEAQVGDNGNHCHHHQPPSPSKTDIHYIVTEMGGSSLFDFIEMHRPESALNDNSAFGSAIQESVLRSVFTQLSLALHSLHAQSVVHGDIKDENALINVDPVTNTYQAKICDFGHSKHLKPGSGPSFTFYGTTILAPPEMDSNITLRAKRNRQQQQSQRRKLSQSSNQVDCWKRFLGYEADVWAMGLMLYTMIHGDLPSELSEKDPKLLAAYKRRRRSGFKKFPFEHLQEGLDADLKDLLEKMLAVDPDRRITMSEVISHPWMAKG